MTSPAAPGLYGPVQDDLPLVEQTLRSVAEVEFPALARMLTHVLGAGGKRIRPALALLAGRFGKYDVDGTKAVQRWYKFDWKESTDGVVRKVSDTLSAIVRTHIENAAKRLSTLSQQA